MMDVCLLNGRLLPAAEARIDPLDRGFLFGDSLYEVIKVLGGVTLHAAEHFARLRTGLARVGIPEPPNLERGLRDLVSASALATGSIYVQVSRGAGPRSHLPPPGLEPTLLMLPREHAFAPMGTERLTATSLADPRWRQCDLKTNSLLANILAIRDARAAGFDEVLFVGEEGELREGGHTNVFVRRGDALETHPLDGRILPGVNRAKLIELALAAGFPVVERAPVLAERASWREAFLSGTYTGIQPLVALDGEPVGSGAPGPWTLALAEALEATERRLAGG